MMIFESQVKIGVNLHSRTGTRAADKWVRKWVAGIFFFFQKFCYKKEKSSTLNP